MDQATLKELIAQVIRDVVTEAAAPAAAAVAPGTYGDISLQLSWIKNIEFGGEFFSRAIVFLLALVRQHHLFILEMHWGVDRRPLQHTFPTSASANRVKQVVEWRGIAVQLSLLSAAD